MANEIKKILFYPYLPKGWHKVRYYCHNLNIAMTNDVNDDYQLAFHYNDKSSIMPYEHNVFDAILYEKKKKIINAQCTDVSKRRVEFIFEKTFGYPLGVSNAFQGRCIKKHNTKQGEKDVQIVTFTGVREKDFTYQKLLTQKKQIKEYRIYYFRGRIPFICEQHKDISEHIKGKVIDYRHIANPKEILSDELLYLIGIFCNNLFMEYGELDTMFDDEGNYYIYDANNIPGDALFTKLGEVEGKKIEMLLTDEFERMIKKYV